MQTKVIASEVLSRIVTVDQLLNIYNISLEDWEIERQIVNTWEVGAKGPDDKIVTTPLFQVKVWLKSKREIRTLESIRQEFLEDLKALSPKVGGLHAKKGVSKSSRLLQINIFDLHLGKIAWEKEVGANYDLDIASERFNNCIDHFIATAKGYNISRIILPIGNDFFNSDKAHPYNATTAGTPQEEDTRWQKTFRTGRSLVIENVNKLTQIAPVDIVMVPGNHDFEKTFYLGDSLEGWFHNNENVTVNNSPNPRKYYSYGKVMIGFTHGDKEKIADLPLIMAQENPVEWGVTTYREFHLGHFHHKKEIKYKSTEEYQGVVIRFMSSLSGTDAWHHSKGYISAKKSAEALIWDPENGLDAQLYFNTK
jgi:hypothetical protein